MATIKDICRICLQEAHYDDVQEISLKKLNLLIGKSLLPFPKSELSFFRDHVVCSTCISNFRTIRNLYSCSWRGNTLIVRFWQKCKKIQKTKGLRIIDLKQLDKFKHLQGDFIICRLCLEPTKHVAVQLFDCPCNLVPWKYIHLMLKTSYLYMSLLDKTINPVLCYKCWQRIQVSFSFRKHLILVMEKLQYYQQLLSKTYVNREDLQDVLDIWDDLGSPTTEIVPIETENFTQPESPTKENSQPNNMPYLEPVYKFFDEHNYFNKLGNPTLGNLTMRSDSSTCSIVDVENDMPFLEPSVEEDLCQMKKPVESDRFLRIRRNIYYGDPGRGVMNSIKERGKQGKKPSASAKKKIINGHSEKLQKLVSNLKINTQRTQDQTDIVPAISPEEDSSRRITRQSTRKELPDELSSKDLLVLQKEEIIKKKPFRKAKLPKHPQCKKSPPKPYANNEYTFEMMNFEGEPQIPQVAIEEDEIQIKREVISDSDNDDFVENVPINASDDGIVAEEQCPNLDAFIKTEPEDIIDVNEEPEEPPELEFQGPCTYGPNFVISNTFTVNDKRHSIATVDEKRSLVNLTSEVPSDDRLVEKKNKASLFKDYMASEYQPLVKDVVISLTKCDKPAVLEFDSSKVTVTSHTVQKPQDSPSIVATSKISQIQNQSPIRLRPNPARNVTNIAPARNVINIAPARKLIHIAPPRQLANIVPARNVANTTPARNIANTTPVRHVGNISPGRDVANIVPAQLRSPKVARLAVGKRRNIPTVNKKGGKKKQKYIPLILRKNQKSKNGEVDVNGRSYANTYESEFYTEIETLAIGKGSPYLCKMCDFVTVSGRAAKCHVALHSNNSVNLYNCEHCPYKTTKKRKWTSHVNQFHGTQTKKCRVRPPTRLTLKQPCFRCGMGDADAKCMNCRKLFHADCLLLSISSNRGQCSHFHSLGSMVISVEGFVSVRRVSAENKEVSQCNFCWKYIQNWVNCHQCNMYFHFRCFYFSRQEKRGSCPHFVNSNRALPLSQPNEVNGLALNETSSKDEEQRRCDFCHQVLDSMIPCPNCFKFMHQPCFLADSTQMNFNCRHADIVGELPPVKCKYCGLVATKNVLTCRLCNRTLHRPCFLIDRVKLTLNCKHYTEIDELVNRKTPYLNNQVNEGAQTSATKETMASTSKETKREMLDLSDFIMLCD